MQNACQQIAGQNFLQTAKVSSAWKRVYQFVQSQDRFLQRQDNFGAKVKSTSRHPTTIASHETKILMGLANSCPGSLTQVVVETSTGSDQVAGIVVTPGLVTVGPHKSSCRVPVEITNNTDHTVVIPEKAVLASLKIAKDVIPPTATENTATTDCDDDFGNLFDLEATNLNAEQKRRTMDMLKKVSYVFARDQNDLGCAPDVEHEIHLSDSIPARQPCRRVPPGQLEEFKESIEQMLSSGVVCTPMLQAWDWVQFFTNCKMARNVFWRMVVYW